MKGQRKVGSSSEQAHIDKLIRDYDKLPDVLKESVKALREERRLTNYVPHPFFQTCYELFWELRNTKSYDHPINHNDIKSLTDLYNIKLDVWEIRAILTFQITWYNSSEKHKD